MIKRSLFRLLCAGGLGLFGGSLLTGDSSGGLGVALLAVAGIWGLLELFILSALLFLYGISGLVHDIGATQDRDYWNRW